MWTRLSIVVLAFVVLVGCQIPAHADSGIDSIFKRYGFPAVSRLTHLCQQRVYPANNPGWHITWDAFASGSTPSALVDEYRKKLGDAGLVREREGGIWRLPAKAPGIERVLEIVPAGAEGPHRSCARKPPVGSRSIILVSKKT
jgi:hypothetical protein